MAICEQCGTDNPPRAKFCLECAAPLAAPTLGREARRTVTIVFCDLVGSTALGESIDPEALGAVLARYFDRMQAIVERHGGTVEKFIGDAVMAVFGVPVLHEDDALRAVRAASEMRAALPELGVQARIGVNTGEVVTGTARALVTGDAVNVAARLEQAAPHGEVYLGARTVQLVRGAEVERVEPLQLKGKAQPVEAFRLLEVADAASLPRRPAGAFIGRERERRNLREAFDLAVSDRVCHLFTLLGVAGVGKSRLVAEALGDLDATVVRARCLSYGDGITYWPVVEAIKQLRPEEHELEEQVARPLRVLLGEEADASKDEIMFAVRRLFEEAASERPLIVVWDDLHWAEDAFLDLVEHVADWSRDAPILMLCMARPELLDRRPAWAGGKLHAATVLLEPLGAAMSDQLLGQLGGDLEPGLRGRILEAAQGNPLFVEEMVAMVAASPGTDVAVPPSIQALLAARLDQLPEHERWALERGAVEGEVFHGSAVQALTTDDSRVPAHLLALVRKELVRPERATVPGDDAFRFRHILIRDAAYDALPKAMRADLHERFADWLETRARDLVELDEIVGYHLGQAHRYLEELGLDELRRRELARRAAGRLTDGGRAALARDDARAAASMLRRSVELLDPADLRRAGALVELANACYEADDLLGSADAARDALALAGAQSDGHVLALAGIAAMRTAIQIDPETTSLGALSETERLISILALSDDDLGLARAWMFHALVLFYLGRTAEALESYERTADFATRAGNHRLEMQVLTGAVAARVHGATPVEEAIIHTEYVLERPLDPSTRSFVYQKRARLEALRGDFVTARAFYGSCRDLALEYGLRLRRGVQTQDGAAVELAAGDPVAAERELREGYAVLAELGEIGFRSTVAAYLADALLAQGRLDDAERAAQDVLELAQEDDFEPISRARGTLARIAASRGDYDAAIAAAREAVTLVEPTDFSERRGDTLATLAWVYGAAGEQDAAGDAAQRALDLFEQKGDVVHAARVRVFLEELGAAGRAGLAG